VDLLVELPVSCFANRERDLKDAAVTDKLSLYLGGIADACARSGLCQSVKAEGWQGDAGRPVLLLHARRRVDLAAFMAEQEAAAAALSDAAPAGRRRMDDSDEDDDHDDDFNASSAGGVKGGSSAAAASGRRMRSESVDSAASFRSGGSRLSGSSLGSSGRRVKRQRGGARPRSGSVESDVSASTAAALKHLQSLRLPAGLRIRIIPTLPAGLFSPSLLRPSWNNVRPWALAPGVLSAPGGPGAAAGAGAAGAPVSALALAAAGGVLPAVPTPARPTPHYNARVAAHAYAQPVLRLLHTVLASCPPAAQALVALKGWARRRGLHRAADGVSGFLLTALVAHLVQAGAVPPGANALQALRAAFAFLAKTDLAATPVLLQPLPSADESDGGDSDGGSDGQGDSDSDRGLAAASSAVRKGKGKGAGASQLAGVARMFGGHGDGGSDDGDSAGSDDEDDDDEGSDAEAEELDSDADGSDGSEDDDEEGATQGSRSTAARRKQLKRQQKRRRAKRVLAANPLLKSRAVPQAPNAETVAEFAAAYECCVLLPVAPAVLTDAPAPASAAPSAGAKAAAAAAAASSKRVYVPCVNLAAALSADAAAELRHEAAIAHAALAPRAGAARLAAGAGVAGAGAGVGSADAAAAAVAAQDRTAAGAIETLFGVTVLPAAKYDSITAVPLPPCPLLAAVAAAAGGAGAGAVAAGSPAVPAASPCSSAAAAAHALCDSGSWAAATRAYLRRTLATALTDRVTALRVTPAYHVASMQQQTAAPPAAAVDAGGASGASTAVSGAFGQQRWLAPEPLVWPLHTPPPTPSCLLVASVANPAPSVASRMVDRGPAPEAAAAAAAFNALWGPHLAELRRFADGAIVNAVVWEGDKLGGRSYARGGIVASIVGAIAGRHLGIPLPRAPMHAGDAALLLPRLGFDFAAPAPVIAAPGAGAGAASGKKGAKGVAATAVAALAAPVSGAQVAAAGALAAATLACEAALQADIASLTPALALERCLDAGGPGVSIRVVESSTPRPLALTDALAIASTGHGQQSAAAGSVALAVSNAEASAVPAIAGRLPTLAAAAAASGATAGGTAAAVAALGKHRAALLGNDPAARGPGVSFAGAQQALDYVLSALRAAPGLPVKVASAQAISPQLRYTSMHAPALHPLAAGDRAPTAEGEGEEEEEAAGGGKGKKGGKAGGRMAALIAAMTSGSRGGRGGLGYQPLTMAALVEVAHAAAQSLEDAQTLCGGGGGGGSTGAGGAGGASAAPVQACQVVQPLEVILSLESSNRWPDDPLAIAALKAAFYLKLKYGLTASQRGILYATAHADRLDVTVGGYAFRLYIHVPRMLTQLERVARRAPLTGGAAGVAAGLHSASYAAGGAGTSLFALGGAGAGGDEGAADEETDGYDARAAAGAASINAEGVLVTGGGSGGLYHKGFVAVAPVGAAQPEAAPAPTFGSRKKRAQVSHLAGLPYAQALAIASNQADAPGGGSSKGKGGAAGAVAAGAAAGAGAITVSAPVAVSGIRLFGSAAAGGGVGFGPAPSPLQASLLSAAAGAAAASGGGRKGKGGASGGGAGDSVSPFTFFFPASTPLMAAPSPAGGSASHGQFSAAIAVPGRYPLSPAHAGVWLDAIHMREVARPAHAARMHSLAKGFPAFGPAVRLACLWLSAHGWGPEAGAAAGGDALPTLPAEGRLPSLVPDDGEGGSSASGSVGAGGRAGAASASAAVAPSGARRAAAVLACIDVCLRHEAAAYAGAATRPHMPLEAVELTVAHVFTSPQPYAVPTSAVTALLRWLHLLGSHSWASEPLLVSTATPLAEEDAAEAAAAAAVAAAAAAAGDTVFGKPDPSKDVILASDGRTLRSRFLAARSPSGSGAASAASAVGAGKGGQQGQVSGGKRKFAHGGRGGAPAAAAAAAAAASSRQATPSASPASAAAGPAMYLVTPSERGAWRPLWTHHSPSPSVLAGIAAAARQAEGILSSALLPVLPGAPPAARCSASRAAVAAGGISKGKPVQSKGASAAAASPAAGALASLQALVEPATSLRMQVARRVAVAVLSGAAGGADGSGSSAAASATADDTDAGRGMDALGLSGQWTLAFSPAATSSGGASAAAPAAAEGSAGAGASGPGAAVDAASPHALLQLRGAMLPRTLADGRTHGAVKAPLQCAAAAALLPTMAAAAAITAALASLPAGVRAAAAPALLRLAHGLSLSSGGDDGSSGAGANGPFGGAAAISPLEVAAALSAAFGGGAAATASSTGPSAGGKGSAVGGAGGRAVLLPLTLGGVHVDASNFNLPLYKNLLSTSRSGLLVSFEPALALLHTLRARYGHGASLSLLLGSAGLSVRQGVEAAVEASGLSALLASSDSAGADGATAADAALRWSPAALEGSLRSLSITGAGPLALAPSAAIAVSWRHGALAASDRETAGASSGGKAAPAASSSASAAAAAAAGFELVPGLNGTSAAGEGLRRMWRQQRAAAVLAEMSAAGAGVVKSAALLHGSA
jgi:hypothetical protein